MDFLPNQQITDQDLRDYHEKRSLRRQQILNKLFNKEQFKEMQETKGKTTWKQIILITTSFILLSSILLGVGFLFGINKNIYYLALIQFFITISMPLIFVHIRYKDCKDYRFLNSVLLLYTLEAVGVISLATTLTFFTYYLSFVVLGINIFLALISIVCLYIDYHLRETTNSYRRIKIIRSALLLYASYRYFSFLLFDGSITKSYITAYFIVVLVSIPISFLILTFQKETFRIVRLVKVMGIAIFFGSIFYIQSLDKQLIFDEANVPMKNGITLFYYNHRYYYYDLDTYSFEKTEEMYNNINRFLRVPVKDTFKVNAIEAEILLDQVNSRPNVINKHSLDINYYIKSTQNIEYYYNDKYYIFNTDTIYIYSDDFENLNTIHLNPNDFHYHIYPMNNKMYLTKYSKKFDDKGVVFEITDDYLTEEVFESDCLYNDHIGEFYTQEYGWFTFVPVVNKRENYICQLHVNKTEEPEKIETLPANEIIYQDEYRTVFTKNGKVYYANNQFNHIEINGESYSSVYSNGKIALKSMDGYFIYDLKGLIKNEEEIFKIPYPTSQQFIHMIYQDDLYYLGVYIDYSGDFYGGDFTYIMNDQGTIFEYAKESPRYIKTDKDTILYLSDRDIDDPSLSTKPTIYELDQEDPFTLFVIQSEVRVMEATFILASITCMFVPTVVSKKYNQ